MPSVLRCPLCAAAGPLRALEQSDGYQLYVCGACDLTFSDPMHGPGSVWYDTAYIVRHVAVDDRIREYYRWALDRLPPGCRVLDVGCGEGTFVAYARHRGFDAWGIDFSSASIEAGRRRYRLTTLREGTIEAFLASDHPAVEGVTAFEVLEHVESPIAFLRGVRDVLSPGGHLILSVPNRDRWPVREFSDYPPNHLTRWSEPSLRRAAAAAGLATVTIRQTSRFHSINALYGYVPRLALYRIIGWRGRGLGRPRPPGRTSVAVSLLSHAGPWLRRLRDLAMWVPAVLTVPILWHRCQGYNLMLHARRPM